MLREFVVKIIFSCVDFSKNYTMKIQHKVQNKHWHNFQVSILIHISYQHNPLVDVINLDSTIIKEIHYYVFDDPNHDSLFVQHVFMLH